MMKRIKKISAALLATVLFFTLIPGARAYDSLTYLYGGTTAVYLARMDKTADNINIVSPDYFETAADGSVIYTKVPDPLLIAAMHDRDIKVTPFLSNHWERDKARAMLKRKEEAAIFIADSVKLYGMDGVDIDLQNINEADRADFVEFIKLLRAALPEDKDLTVCVAANPWALTIGWQGGYDYAQLAKHCDHVFMMTYDESYDGSAPGPVASYDFIEKSISYGLKYVPPEKLMIGIPFYGRFWTDTVKGAAFTIADIEWLVKNTKSSVWYDEAKDCARATVIVPPGETVTTWGGRKVSPGVYDIWYENARSFEKKLSLVRKYGLKGVGSWALGQEPTYVWDNFAVWLHGLQFTDIRNHWAQSYIVGLANRGIINGRTSDSFDPDGFLTRAEAASLLARLAGLKPEPGANDFADTVGHWASGEISAARKAQLVSGVSGTRFEPDRRVTREEFAVMAMRYTNVTEAYDNTQSPYSDVSKASNGWSMDAIIGLSLNGILSGYPDGTFRPKEPITRAEAAKVITLLEDLPTRFLGDKILPIDDRPMSPR